MQKLTEASRVSVGYLKYKCIITREQLLHCFVTNFKKESIMISDNKERSTF